MSFLLAEQNTMVALRYANYGYILENGRVVMDGAATELASQRGREGVLPRPVDGAGARASATSSTIAAASAGWRSSGDTMITSTAPSHATHRTSLPGATVDIKWGADECYCVGGKMFAVFGDRARQGGSVSFKCDPERFLELTDSPGIIPAPYLARAHWVQVEDAKALPTRRRARSSRTRTR